MSPEVIQRKLALLRTYRKDIAEYVAAGTVQANHYAVERLVELIVECMYDLISHWLSSRGYAHPDTYAEVFLEAGRRNLVTAELAESLAKGARMRNLLAHVYERIDLNVLEKAVPGILKDVDAFIAQVRSARDGAAGS